MVEALSKVVPRITREVSFLLNEIEDERTVLYCGGAETVTGVPNSGSSFGILSLHRLTFPVVGADDDEDDDDGSAKRMRRRSENKNSIGTTFSSNNVIYHWVEEVLVWMMFLQEHRSEQNFIQQSLPSSSSLISSLSLKIGGRPGGGPGAFLVITMR